MADAALVKALRDETGLSFDKIKKALDEAGGDRDKALGVLRAQAGESAAKKSERLTGEGAVASYVHMTGKVGAMVTLLCETDFVARNEDFKALARDLAMHVTAMRPADAAELLAQQFVKDPGLTVQDAMNQAIQKLGENIKLGAFDLQVIG
jgi:elongation factor Ts